MFYKADEVSSGRSSFLSRDATELVLMMMMMMMMMMILIYVQETSRRYRDVLSLGFKYKVLFIQKPKTTRGKKTPL
jgi:uncharacterized protein YjgD (DUF1641 family)